MPLHFTLITHRESICAKRRITLLHESTRYFTALNAILNKLVKSFLGLSGGIDLTTIDSKAPSAGAMLHSLSLAQAHDS